MTDAEYKATKIAEAQSAVEAAERKVAKLKGHLSGALDSVEVARAELAEVEATDYVWAVSTERVTARAR